MRIYGGRYARRYFRKIAKEIYERCRKETNQFGMGCYYHIAAVVKNAEILAEKYGAEKEVVMIAAWLHDVASVTDYSLYELHHIHGAEMAYDILTEYGYDSEKIPLVQACIRNHRGSVNLEKIVRKNSVLPMRMQFRILTAYPIYCIWLMFKRNGTGRRQEFVKAKLVRSFQKLSEESKKYYQNKFEKVMEVLG